MPDDHQQAQISMHHIPVRGGVGSAMLVAILVWSVLADLPQLRWRFLAGLTAGVLFAAALIVWRGRTSKLPPVPYAARAMFGRWR